MKKNGPAFGAIGSGAADGNSTKNQKNIIEFQTDPFDWWPALVNLVAGPGHGLRVGVNLDCGFETIEIIGTLPKQLRKGLRRYAPWNTRNYAIEWVPRSGYKTRYELQGLPDLLQRLADRRALLEGAA